MSPITKVLIGALATFSAVQALPQNAYQTQAPPNATATSVAGTPSGAPPPAGAPGKFGDEFVAQLLTAPTAIKRFKKLLTDAGKLLAPEQLRNATVFDFNNAKPATGAKGAVAKGGATKSANIDSFPILTDLGISTTMGFLNGCGMNTPHVHPRATEFLTVVEGEVEFGYILENGLVDAGNKAEVTGNLQKYQGSVFPMGSIHYQFNPKCEPAVFVATLNSEDPGTSQVAQNFFGLNGEVVNATIGRPKSLDGKDLQSFRELIPLNVALAIQKCVDACGEA